jgi:hypothetical protein
MEKEHDRNDERRKVTKGVKDRNKAGEGVTVFSLV